MHKLLASVRKLNLPGIIYGVIFLFLFFSVLNPTKFLSLVNLQLILRHTSILIIASIGMTLAILVSQIDMSIGAVLSLSGVVMAVLLQSGLPLALCVLCALLSGVAVGLVNGTLIAVFRFDFWISTFATMGIGAGLALVISNGRTIPVSSAALNWIGNGRIGGVYIIICIMILLSVAVCFLLNRSRFGYDIYSVGGSEQSAFLSGINVVRVRMLVYVLSGFFASLGGILLTSMGASANPIAGVDYAFEAIAAVIIGGSTFEGGKGSFLGTIFGALMLRVLANGLNSFGLPSTWQKAMIGAVIVLVLVASVLSEKRKVKNAQRRVYANE